MLVHTDSAGAASTINSYDEYGIPRTTNVGRFQYTGQAWLPELGMSYYKARMYSPTLGRFMQTDPIGYGDGMNMYNYVRSDPVNFTDPTGLLKICLPVSVASPPNYQDQDGTIAWHGPKIIDHCQDVGDGLAPRVAPVGPGDGQGPQSDPPCQNKSLGVQLGEAALGGLGLLGDGAQVVGAYTGFVPLAAAGTAAEYVSIGGSALLHWSTGDTHGLVEDGANFAAGLAPWGRIARKVGGAAADWGRRANGQYVKGWNRKQKAQNAAYSSGQSTLVSGGSICPVKSG